MYSAYAFFMISGKQRSLGEHGHSSHRLGRVENYVQVVLGEDNSYSSLYVTSLHKILHKVLTDLHLWFILLTNPFYLHLWFKTKQPKYGEWGDLIFIITLNLDKLFSIVQTKLASTSENLHTENVLKYIDWCSCILQLASFPNAHMIFEG